MVRETPVNDDGAGRGRKSPDLRSGQALVRGQRHHVGAHFLTVDHEGHESAVEPVDADNAWDGFQVVSSRFRQVGVGEHEVGSTLLGDP